MYNDVLNVQIPKEVTVVGYVNDIALFVVAKHFEDAEMYSCGAISAVRIWLQIVGLVFAEEKTKLTSITKHRKRA